MNIKEKKFKVGDMVRWTSGAGGVQKTKAGEVVAVIPERRPVTDALNKIRVKFNRQFDGFNPRMHESYLVLVGDKLYWPRAKGLEKV